jgi:hypothetical protein
MKYDIYGRFQLEVLRESGAWAVYRIGQGVKSFAHDVVLPSDLEVDQIATFLDDLFHESDTSGRGVHEQQ